MIHIGSLKSNYLRICNRNDALLIISAVKRPPISTLCLYVCIAYPEKGYICVHKTYSQTSAESSIPKSCSRPPKGARRGDNEFQEYHLRMCADCQKLMRLCGGREIHRHCLRPPRLPPALLPRRRRQQRHRLVRRSGA